MVTAIVACVGLLAAPRLAGSRTLTGEQMTEQAKEQLRTASQSHLRRTLLRLLASVDLEDAGTQKLLLVPMEHLRRLSGSCDLGKCDSSKQWLALAVPLGMHTPMQQRVANESNANMGHKAISGGIYTPNPATQRAPNVERKIDHVVNKQ